MDSAEAVSDGAKLLWENLRKEQADPATRAREVHRDLANPPRLVGL